MIIDSELLDNIILDFNSFAEEELNDYDGLNISLKDNMTPEECAEALDDAIAFTFPIYYGPLDETGCCENEYTMYDFIDDFLVPYGIYYDEDRKIDKAFFHNEEEHDEWYKTTDEYKHKQEQNAIFTDAVNKSDGTVIVYPGYISPEDSRIGELLPKDSGFKFIIGTDRDGNYFITGIGRNRIYRPEFDVIRPEGFLYSGYFTGFPHHEILVFDSFENAKKTADYMSVDLTRTDITDSEIPKSATDYVEDVLKVFGIEYKNVGIAVMPVADKNGGSGETQTEIFDVEFGFRGHKPPDNILPGVSFDNWQAALDAGMKIGEKPVPLNTEEDIPVYKNSRDYAEMFDETDMYVSSELENNACLSMMQREIRKSPDMNCVSKESMQKVIDEFGADRTSWVMANTIHALGLGCGIFSQDSSLNDWADRICLQGGKLQYRSDRNCTDEDFDPYSYIHPSIATGLISEYNYKDTMSRFAFGMCNLLNEQTAEVQNEHTETFADKESEDRTLRGKVQNLQNAARAGPAGNSQKDICSKVEASKSKNATGHGAI